MDPYGPAIHGDVRFGHRIPPPSTVTTQPARPLRRPGLRPDETPDRRAKASPKRLG